MHADLDALVIALYVTIDQLLGPAPGQAGHPSSVPPNWSAWPSPGSCSGSAPSGAGCADAELVGPAAAGRLHPGAVRGQPRDGQTLGAGRPAP